MNSQHINLYSALALNYGRRRPFQVRFKCLNALESADKVRHSLIHSPAVDLVQFKRLNSLHLKM